MCPSTDKEDMVHTHNGILLNHKKQQYWVICEWPWSLILQSEVSQKEKNGYRILIHIHGT